MALKPSDELDIQQLFVTTPAQTLSPYSLTTRFIEQYNAKSLLSFVLAWITSAKLRWKIKSERFEKALFFRFTRKVEESEGFCPGNLLVPVVENRIAWEKIFQCGKKKKKKRLDKWGPHLINLNKRFSVWFQS